MDFFSIIGTVASIGSIPLSLYLYIKSKENNIDKVKRDIVRVLSHQIGDRRQLTTFEIQTVINSRTRESKIDAEKITVNQIIEDLVSETISNPLLDKSIKEIIIAELRNIYFKNELLTSIDRIELETRSSGEAEKKDLDLEKELKKIIESRNKIKEETDIQEKKVNRTSERFAAIATATTLLATALTFSGKDNYDNIISKPLYNFLQKNDFYIGLVSSIIAGISAIIILSIYVAVGKYRKQSSTK
jgi:hypothetical protein